MQFLTLWGAQGRPGNGGQSRAGIAAHASPGGAPLRPVHRGGLQWPGLELIPGFGGAGDGRGRWLCWDPAGIQVGYRGGLPAPAAGLILPVITREEEREFAVGSIVRSQVK